MNLNPIKANMTEIAFGDEYDTRVLFSYRTPVAYTQLTPEGKLYFAVDHFYSRTTSKHINSWIPKEGRQLTTEGNINLLVQGFKAEVK